MKYIYDLIVGFFAMTAGLCYGANHPAACKDLSDYIDRNICQSVRYLPEDNGIYIGLPKPFSVPCTRGAFQEMYYWDTYFTNLGLLRDGDYMQVRNNIDNIAYLIGRYGFMPNGSNIYELNRSQPPYFSMMVRDYFDATGDRQHLAELLPYLEKEYRYWDTHRKAPNGLNRYGHSATDAELRDFFNAIAGRVCYDPAKFTDAEKISNGAHLLAEAESGWDFNPRYDMRCMDFNPVDLNSLLYAYETNMAYFYDVLGKSGSDVWRDKAKARAAKMRRLMIDPKTGLYFDYDYKNGHRSEIYSGAAFWPFWTGVATPEDAKALKAALQRLEVAHGVNACERGPRTLRYQWDAPNGWSAITYAAVAGLDRYGYKADANRIAGKYVDALASLYEKTGQLWEKYNAETGSNDVSAEYATPGNFMGWTAGVYQDFYHRLYGRDKTEGTPRIVNIVNFIRQTEPRRLTEAALAHVTDSVLLATTAHQLELMNEYGVPGTFLIQYDALINPEYQKLLKSGGASRIEIGGWYEITEPHVKAAGLKWRGRYPWDWHSNVGFSVGYTPKERKKLVDAYMKKFKEVFGKYPSTVGSWFIDAATMDYMQKKYGVRTAAVCRDQIGTDGYNLWGGYWQGGYYPSKNNFFVPAGTPSEQIDIATFRMLGSDPIEQYDSGLGGNHQAVITLEPVFSNCGGSSDWTNRYLGSLTSDPAMTLAYAQAGQENMFTWDTMKKGYEYQIPRIGAMANRGDLRLETLGETGEWFHRNFETTPPSAVSSLTAYKKEGRRTVWFNSRNYRLNIMQRHDTLYVRDMHIFDQNQPERYLKQRCTTPDAHYLTLPLVDGNVWSDDTHRAALYFYDAAGIMLRFGAPEVKNDGATLTYSTPLLSGKGSLTIKADENSTTFTIEGCKGWYARLVTAPGAELPFKSVKDNELTANFENFDYSVKLRNGKFGSDMSIRPTAASFTILPESACAIAPAHLRCEQMENPPLVEQKRPRLSWVNTPYADGGDALRQTAYRIGVSSSEKLLRDGIYDVWNSGRIESSGSRLIPVGTELKPESNYYWRVMVWDGNGTPSAWSGIGRFSTGMKDCKAQWLGGKHLMKTVELTRPLESAKIYVSAMGYFDMEINGRKVGKDLLSPNFSNYTYRDDIEKRGIAIDNEFTDYRIYYMAYDADSLFVTGDNVIDVKVGDGFARTSAGWDSSFGEPRFLAKIVLKYADGDSEEILTDGTWLSGLSPIVMDGVFDGEIYDANLTDFRWQPARILPGPTGTLTPQTSPADCVTATFGPVGIERKGDKCWHVIFPEEISGHIRFKGLKTAKGDTIDVKYQSEMQQGVQRYISDGTPAHYAPRFTWFVFSEADICGVDTLDASQIVAESVNTDIPVTSAFSCSDHLLEEILRIWRRSQTDNFHGGIASDCPHRERSPYTGDGQVCMPVVMANYDAEAFYRKWIRDMRDAQNPRTGYVPNGAPWQPGCGGGVAWGAAMSLMPWEYYVNYGDMAVLRENYPAMVKQLDYMKSWLTSDGTMYAQRGNCGAPESPVYWLNLGDWCAPGELPSDELVHTYFMWKCADYTSKAAEALGDKDKAHSIAAFRDSVATAFHSKFYNAETGSYGKAGADIFALDMGVPAERLEKVKGAVVQNLAVDNKGHLDTGIFATRLLFETLARYGMNDLAYQVMTAKGFPGFADWLDRGAKATWEKWNGTDSRNHPMFGGGLTWYASTLAGLQADERNPGFHHFTVAPVPAKGLDRVNWTQETNFGTISINLDYYKGLELTVPVGTTATVVLPWAPQPQSAGPGCHFYAK